MDLYVVVIKQDAKVANWTCFISHVLPLHAKGWDLYLHNNGLQSSVPLRPATKWLAHFVQVDVSES